jgi:hypothetical protein
MVIWGWLLFTPAAIALASDGVLRLSRGRARWSYIAAWACHWMLACVYVALTAVALYDGLTEVPWGQFTHHFGVWFAGFVSSLSRPVLWWVVTYLHTTFARLPIPPKEVLESIGEGPTEGVARA